MTTEQKMCRLCGEKPAAWNGFVCEDCAKKANLQDKAGLILVDSSHADWGMVMLSPGSMGGSTPPEDSELVGYWHRYEEGTYWLSLMMPMTALMDRTTILHAEVARRRAENRPLMGPIKQARRSTGGTRKPRERAEEAEESPQSETIKGLQALRQRIRPQA